MRKDPILGRQCKWQAKQNMARTMPGWMKVTALFVLVSVGLAFVQMQVGGTLGFRVPIEEYPNAVSGIFPVADGFRVILRMEFLGVVLAFPFTYLQIAQFAAVDLIIFLVLTPVRMATMERYWAMGPWGNQSMTRLSRWYLDPKLAGKSIVVQFVVDLGGQLISLIAMIPSMILYISLYSHSVDELLTMPSFQVWGVTFAAFGLLIIGFLAGYLFHSVMLPVVYCLAARPDLSLRKVWKQGLQSLKHYRMAFFRFRLTFLPWEFLSSFTYGAFDLYVLPYTSFSAFHFLQEVARKRQGEQIVMQEQPNQPPQPSR